MRPIDADALKEAFEEDGHLSGYIEDFINDAPTLDVEPVRMGKWTFYPSRGRDEYEYECSLCNEWANQPYPRCPNCSAKMF